MKLVLRAFLVAAFAFVSWASVANAQDMDCWQFGSWQEAQATSDANPWMNLDADHDGIACECLYYGYECWHP